jgi:hypothetical protein
MNQTIKKITQTLFVSFCLIASHLSAQDLTNEVTPDDKQAIETVVLSYIENFFENNSEEMLRYLHPDLAKGGVSKRRGEKTYFFENMEMEQLTELLKTKPVLDKADQKNKIQILDVFLNTANVRLNTGYPDKMEWIEYILLSKIDGKWLINNIMWDYYPRKRSAKSN